MFGPDDFEVQIQQENPPGIHAEPSIPPAQDEEYGDFIVKHGQNMGGKFLPVNELFGILYIPLNEIGPLEINSYTYASLPKCYTFMDADALNSSGITRLHNHPYLKLQGEAGLAAGNFVPTENFSGAAPKATIIVVKLKKAKSYLRKFY